MHITLYLSTQTSQEGNKSTTLHKRSIELTVLIYIYTVCSFHNDVAYLLEHRWSESTRDLWPCLYLSLLAIKLRSRQRPWQPIKSCGGPFSRFIEPGWSIPRSRQTLYRGSLNSTVSTSTNSTSTRFQKVHIKFHLYDFALKSPSSTKHISK